MEIVLEIERKETSDYFFLFQVIQILRRYTAIFNLNIRNGVHMSKYPELQHNEINATLRSIKSKSFNTYDFISEWEKLYPNSKNIF